MKMFAMWLALAACLSPVFVAAQNTIPATTQVKITHADGTQVTLTVKKGETPALAEGDQVTSVDGPAVTFIAPGGDKVTAQSGSTFSLTTRQRGNNFRVEIKCDSGSVSVTDLSNNTQTLDAGRVVRVATYNGETSVSYTQYGDVIVAYTATNVLQDVTNPATRTTP